MHNNVINMQKKEPPKDDRLPILFPHSVNFHHVFNHFSDELFTSVQQNENLNKKIKEFVTESERILSRYASNKGINVTTGIDLRLKKQQLSNNLSIQTLNPRITIWGQKNDVISFISADIPELEHHCQLTDKLEWRFTAACARRNVNPNDLSIVKKIGLVQICQLQFG